MSSKALRKALAVAPLLVLQAACQPASGPAESAVKQAPASLDADRLQQILLVEPSIDAGHIKFAVPRNDLDVTVDEFAIVPAMGLTSWVVFAPAADGAVVMGDLVVAEDEIGPAQKQLIASGLTVTALHNHFVRDRPGVMFMHIHGSGNSEALAAAVRATLDAIEEIRRPAPDNPPRTVSSTLDPDSISSALGHEGSLTGGIYKVTIGRRDVELTHGDTRVTTFMGFNTWMAFQGTAERAAVSGDFAMLASEVAPVIEALVSADIEVVAVHNHMIGEDPPIFFLHFWGVGLVQDLTRGLRAGLDRLGGPPANG